MRDFREADLPESLRALGEYAEKLTKTPHAMNEGDIARLRSCGFDDAQILAANLVASYFNFINRVADGLGVDLEPWMAGRTPF